MRKKINNFLKNGFEIGVIRKLKTGFAYDIIVDEVGTDRVENMDPNLVLSNEVEQYLISIEKNPKVLEGTTSDTDNLKYMMSFIADNCEIFLAHWKHDIDLADLQSFCINNSKKHMTKSQAVRNVIVKELFTTPGMENVFDDLINGEDVAINRR